jgi:hypothetical protein
MIKRFLRLFREYRDLERNLEGEAALAESMKRYIDALEGRDRERLARIEWLEAKDREACAIIGSMRGRLTALHRHLKEGT